MNARYAMWRASPTMLTADEAACHVLGLRQVRANRLLHLKPTFGGSFSPG